MSDKIIDFPTNMKPQGENAYLFAVDEGQIEIKEGDTPLTVATSLMLLERCALMIKKGAGWL